MQQFAVLQSMWAMEHGVRESPCFGLEQKIDLVLREEFDGVSTDLGDEKVATHLAKILKPLQKIIEGIAVPRSIDELKRSLDFAADLGVHHVAVQLDSHPREIKQSIRIIDDYRRVIEKVSFPVYLETHRGRLTNDLNLTLELLDCYPDLRLLGDLSHYMVSREFAYPISSEVECDIQKILHHCWAFHGRVASPEQVQVQLSYPTHQVWFDVFLGWWRSGFESWQKRAGPNDVLSFVCELGPAPYAIVDRSGEETSDRWQEALLMRQKVREIWDMVSRTPNLIDAKITRALQYEVTP